MQRIIHIAIPWLLVLAGLTLPPIAAPQPAAAADVTVSTCDWPTFSQTLDEVQDDGGGTITFDCSEPILFDEQLEIDTDVTIIGASAGQVVFDGQNSTRLFTVNSGARLVLNNLTLQNGYAGDDDGGAIVNHGTLEITASTFSGNASSSTYAVGSEGGAIYNTGTLVIATSTLDDNSSRVGGAIVNHGTLEITASTFSGNTSLSGGVIRNDEGTVVVTASTFSSNSATNGGVIDNLGGTVEIISSTFSGNSATSAGAISHDSGRLEITTSTFSSNVATSGGAIFNNEGTLEITASTFTGNSATGAGAINNNDEGTLKITASTFTGNSAVGSGAIRNQGTLEVTASTFSGNSAGFDGSAIGNSGTATVQGSILTNSPSGSNCDGIPITSLGYNLSDDDSCNLTSTTDLPTTDPMLEPLGHYGGPTQTFRPLPASPAIDHIPASACPTDEQGSILPDQRGVARPQNTRCDIGSVELQGEICISQSTGAVSEPEANGCGRYARTVSLEYGGPLTFCANRVTGDLHLSATGACARTELRLALPDDGPITVCIDRVTRLMRLADASGCTRYEVARLIGALPPEPRP